VAAAYSENRPAFLGESLDSITVSIGESIVGATFAATMFDPSGNAFTAPVVTILNAGSGTISIALPVVPTTAIPGLWRYACNWVNNGNLLVSYGVVEYTDPIGQHS